MTQNLRVLYVNYDNYQETIVSSITAQSMIADKKRSWRKVHFKMICDTSKTALGHDGKWLFESVALTKLHNFKQLT